MLRWSTLVCGMWCWNFGSRHLLLLLAISFLGCLLEPCSAGRRSNRLYDELYFRLSKYSPATKLDLEKRFAASPETVIAIDIGTTYSRVGICNYSTNAVKVLPNEQGNLMTPSLISFTGTKSTAMLTKMKETAKAFLGKEVKDAVITIPAYFNDAQRQATKEAHVMAGLNVLRLIPKPRAAATAYYLYEEVNEQNILVFDLGGGTFDVTILTAENFAFEILATVADIHLGGNDFDKRVMEYFMTLVKETHGKDISKDSEALTKLRSECERAKIALSTQHQVQVEIKPLFDGVDFSEPLTRAQFEELNNDLFNKTIGYVKKAMEDAGLETHQIDDVVLVGGSTKIPKVRQLLKDYFDEADKVVEDPEIDEIVLVGGSSKIPKVRPIFKDCFDVKKANKGVDPGEAVALGAAVEGAATFSRERAIEEFLSNYGPLGILALAGPLPYGVRTAGGAMTRLVLGRVITPLQRSRVFTTTRDNQTRILIEIYDGIKSLTRRCSLLEKFELSGIPPAPRGTPRIEVTIRVEPNDTIEIKAEDKGTGKSEKINFPKPESDDGYWTEDKDEL